MENNWKRLGWGAVVIGIVLAFTLKIFAAESPKVPFPDDYRSWQHVKSVVATEGGKIFQFYANPSAIEGYRTGKFPNGSILVRETLKTVPDDGSAKGMHKEGDRTALDVMVKNDGLYSVTGGWGFDTFNNEKTGLAEKDRAQCYACHSKQKDRDAVFTSFNAADAGTPYPEGYRHWTFLHSSMVPANFSAFGNKPCEKPCMAGIFHFYANDKAMVGLRTGTYPDGSIIAEEMLEWLSTNTGAKEGQRRVIGVMVKDHERYASTDGWGYGNFDDGSRIDKLDAKARQACHQCHIARKDQGYVFTEYRER